MQSYLPCFFNTYLSYGAESSLVTLESFSGGFKPNVYIPAYKFYNTVCILYTIRSVSYTTTEYYVVLLRTITFTVYTVRTHTSRFASPILCPLSRLHCHYVRTGTLVSLQKVSCIFHTAEGNSCPGSSRRVPQD